MCRGRGDWEIRQRPVGPRGGTSLVPRAALRDRPARIYQALVMGVGSPTLMKNLANDCERCSRYGGSNFNLFASRSEISVSRKARGTVWTLWKSTIRCSVVMSPS